MSFFLIDTSIWVSFFRGDPAVTARVDPLLAERRVAVAAPIYAELLSGAPTQLIQNQLRTMLKSLRWLPEPAAIWDRLADTRFTLARQGYQATMVDVIIAVTAVEAGFPLLTRDRDFQIIGQVLPLSVVII